LPDVAAEFGPVPAGEFGSGAGVASGADGDEFVVVLDGVAAAEQGGRGCLRLSA
jgi:hypothetical protein